MYGCVRTLRPLGAVVRSTAYGAVPRRTIQTNAHRRAAVAEARVDNYAPSSDYAAPGGVDKVAVSKDGSQLSASVSNESLLLDSLFIRDACMPDPLHVRARYVKKETHPALAERVVQY